MDRGAAARPARRVNDQPQRDHFSKVPESVGYCGNKRAIQIYTILARYTSDTRRKAFPSHAMLAQRAGCKTKTVGRAIKFLVTVGAVSYERNRPGRASLYTLASAAARFSIVPEFVGYCENPRAIQIYTILARYTDSQHKAFPSRSTLAKRAGCSEDTVDRAIKFLVTLGALTYIKGGPGRSNSYTLKAKVGTLVRLGSDTGAAISRDTGAAPTKANNENQQRDIAISRSRWRNSDYWKALETVFGYRPHEVSNEGGVWGKLAKMAQDLEDDPAEIVQRAAAWTVGDVWEGWKVPPRLTPAALLKHYQWLGSRVAQASEAEIDAWRMQWRRASRQAALTDNPRTASPDRSAFYTRSLHERNRRR